MSLLTDLFDTTNKLFPIIATFSGLVLAVVLIANVTFQKYILKKHKERLDELEQLREIFDRASKMRRHGSGDSVQKTIEEAPDTERFSAAFFDIIKELEETKSDKHYESSLQKAYETYSLIINKRRYFSFNHYYYSAIDSLFSDSLANAEKKKSNTIVGMMLEDKAAASNKINLYLFGAIGIQFIGSYFGIIPFNVLTILVPLVLLIALHLDQIIVGYRIRKGWYGRNRSEAREIISYILSHANKDDFNDDGGLKKLIEKPEALKPKNFGYKGGEIEI
ncbi:hypothetical protein ACF8PD_14695 [Vibrio plantisponsor]|uniref:hypothetical protein n=1 Tax=Vibrio plantisponsor TaxID=664643 RepID=UPI00370B549C